MARLLPIFPLQLVVFPGAAAPLHIFEERYREMVGEAEATGSEFGIVRTIQRGEDNGIASIGCTVTVESVVHRYPDGRFDVVTRGRRRFQIESIDQEKAYLRAEVEYLDDDPMEQVPPELLQRALDAHKRLQEAAGESQTGAASGNVFTPAPTPTAPTPGRDMSFILAEDIDDLDFRSALLQTRSEAERLRLFAQFALSYIPRKQYVAHMQKKAPTNGFGHHGPATGLHTE